MCLNIQDAELRFLIRLYQRQRREREEPFVSQADMLREWGINRNILYETDELGRHIPGFTIEMDEFIGHNAVDRPTTTYKRKGRLVTIPAEQFLKRITPGNETPDQTKARRVSRNDLIEASVSASVPLKAGPPLWRGDDGSKT